MKLHEICHFRKYVSTKKSLHALRLFELLKKAGSEICCAGSFYQFLTADLKNGSACRCPARGNDFTADMVISIR